MIKLEVNIEFILVSFSFKLKYYHLSNTLINCLGTLAPTRVPVHPASMIGVVCIDYIPALHLQ